MTGAEREGLREPGNAHWLRLHEDRADLVLPHELDRTRAQYLRRTELSVVEQHAHENSVIVRSGVEPTVAARRNGCCHRQRSSRLLLKCAIGPLLNRRYARLFCHRHGERRIAHSKRLEEVLLKIGFERRAADLFYDHSQHARAGAIRPLFTRLVKER